MIKFLLMTRGRTGSTAVMNELSKTRQICATQELFRKRNPGNPEDVFKLIMPYAIWSEEKRLRKYMRMIVGDGYLVKRYLAEAESLARETSRSGFGFKVLSHHFHEHTGLWQILNDMEYKAVFLTRNAVRQVISGLVARQLGTWNTQDDIDIGQGFVIDVDEFQRLVETEQYCVDRDYSDLVSHDFDVIKVHYEDFCEHREKFYDSIFKFLGLEYESPGTSDYKITIKDVRKAVKNYDQISQKADELGYGGGL